MRSQVAQSLAARAAGPLEAAWAVMHPEKRVKKRAAKRRWPVYTPENMKASY